MANFQMMVKGPDGRVGSIDGAVNVTMSGANVTLSPMDPTGNIRISGASVGTNTYLGAAGGTVVVGGATAVIQVGVANSTIGFYGETAIAKPEIPAVYDIDDVVTALVALGLISVAAGE